MFSISQSVNVTILDDATKQSNAYMFWCWINFNLSKTEVRNAFLEEAQENQRTDIVWILNSKLVLEQGITDYLFVIRDLKQYF